MKLINQILFFLSLLIICCCSSNKLSNFNNNNISSKKDSLAIQLIELYGSDQIARRNYRIFLGLDSINFKTLIDFIKINGFPNKELLGEENMKIESVNAAAISVLLHNPHRLVNEKEHLDLLVKEVEKGNLKREFLATILDKYYWAKRDEFGNSRVLYGTQFGKPCRKYRKESDSVRFIIGLKPLPDSMFIDCK